MGNLVLHKSVWFLYERKGYLQRHLFCCFLRFQPSPGVWIETVFIPGRQSGITLALTILPSNSKDDGGVSRNCTFRILSSGHCCKIAVDFMFQVFLSFITKLPERERHQHGCWIDKGEVQNVCSSLLIRIKKRTPVTFIMVPDEWTVSICWRPLEKRTSYPGNPLSARLTYIPNILSGSRWLPLASSGKRRRKTSDGAMTRIWILWTHHSDELNTMRGADSRWFLDQETLAR